jgi:hypothetical protein
MEKKNVVRVGHLLIAKFRGSLIRTKRGNLMRFYVAALVLLAAPAMAADDVAAPQPPAAVSPGAPAASTTPPAKPRLICQTFVPTGSRLGGKKVCMTAKEWQTRADQDQDVMNRASRLGRLRDHD